MTMTMPMILLTLLRPKGRTAEQGFVNTVEKQFIVKLYRQCKIYTIQKKLKNSNRSVATSGS